MLYRRPMSRRAAAAAAVAVLSCLAPLAAEANPTVGVAFGKTQAAGDAQNGDDPNTTVGLFVRGRVARVVSLQAEIAKVQTDASPYSSTIRTYNAAAVVDLLRGSQLVPVVLVGAGLDTLSAYGFGSDTVYKHAELGGGLEYRFRNGFVLGADVRIGTRSTDNPPTYAEPVSGVPLGGAAAGVRAVASEIISDGQYRSARLTLGVHF